MVIPDGPPIPDVTLSLPTADIPSYIPMVVPPNNLQTPDGVTAERKDEEPQQAAEVTKITIPIIDKEIPFPKQEILVTAATTASVSVGATLVATWAFKRSVQVLKPIIKQLVSRIWKKNQKAKA